MKKEKKTKAREKGKRLGFCLLVGTFSDAEREQIKKDFPERRLYDVRSMHTGVMRSAKRSEPVVFCSDVDIEALRAELCKVPRARRRRVQVHVMAPHSYQAFHVEANDEVWTTFRQQAV